ncbi:hypothetical protein Tco_0128405 [Tanacetum coccineum]
MRWWDRRPRETACVTYKRKQVREKERCLDSIEAVRDPEERLRGDDRRVPLGGRCRGGPAGANSENDGYRGSDFVEAWVCDYDVTLFGIRTSLVESLLLSSGEIMRDQTQVWKLIILGRMIIMQNTDEGHQEISTGEKVMLEEKQSVLDYGVWGIREHIDYSIVVTDVDSNGAIHIPSM